MLTELYNLLRNTAIMADPLSAKDAVQVIECYRNHPTWRLAENAPIMQSVWTYASKQTFARRRIYDTRLALTLLHHGVTEFATANVKYFKGYEFKRVWNPLL